MPTPESRGFDVLPAAGAASADRRAPPSGGRERVAWAVRVGSGRGCAVSAPDPRAEARGSAASRTGGTGRREPLDGSGEPVGVARVLDGVGVALGDLGPAVADAVGLAEPDGVVARPDAAGVAVEPTAIGAAAGVVVTSTLADSVAKRQAGATDMATVPRRKITRVEPFSGIPPWERPSSSRSAARPVEFTTRTVDSAGTRSDRTLGSAAQATSSIP